MDIYVANGHWTLDNHPTNIYFKNRAGKTFEDKTKFYDLKEHGITFSYLAEDFDNDGDLDLFYIPLNLEPYIMENRGTQKKSLSFEIKERGSISPVVGSEVTIFHGGTQQKRHILYSGGFRSQDSGRLYFGLGNTEKVDYIEIRKGQDLKRIEGPFEASRNYQINLKK